MPARLNRLAADQRGATLVEFALILPPLLLTLMGLLDMTHNMYTAQMLKGAVQKAARDSTIEGAQSNWAALDGKVTAAVRAVSPSAQLQFKRAAYRDFSNIGRPENWTDLNRDGRCNNGEPYEDINGNGQWDRRPGTTGQGSAGDAVLYTVTINYARMFPIAAFIPGQPSTMQMQAVTVLRNQPYSATATQPDNPRTGNCR